MSGTDIIGALLSDDPDVMQAVTAASMKAGALPENIILPALLLRIVSVVDWQPLKRGALGRSAARVAVLVRAASYREQTTIMKLVRRCCIGRTGTIAGFGNVAVLSAGLGPDLRGPGNTYEQTQDFRVSFNDPL